MNPIPLRPALALAFAALALALPVRAEIPYRSAFEAVRPHTDPQALGWRAANEQVAALGGHAGHLRAAAAPAAPATQPQDSPPAGTPAPATQQPVHGAHGASGERTAAGEGGMPACPMHAQMPAQIHGQMHGQMHGKTQGMRCHGGAPQAGGVR